MTADGELSFTVPDTWTRDKEKENWPFVFRREYAKSYATLSINGPCAKPKGSVQDYFDEKAKEWSKDGWSRVAGIWVDV